MQGIWGHNIRTVSGIISKPAIHGGQTSPSEARVTIGTVEVRRSLERSLPAGRGSFQSVQIGIQRHSILPFGSCLSLAGLPV